MNNIGLVKHCKKALEEKWGYVWGTFGQILTPALLEYKLKQYPLEIGRYKDYIQSNYLGKRTVDCIGLIKSYLWWDGKNPLYKAETDKTADGFFQMAVEKGNIGTLPDICGIAVYYKGHVGVYIGNGKVIEARGTKYGVVETNLVDRPWTHWFKVPFVKYEDRPHWAEDPYNYLKERIVVHEKRFNEPITRGEVFALLAQVVSLLDK